MSELISLSMGICIGAHAGQVRKYTGEDYHNHPFEVERILYGVGASKAVRAAGLLHDVLEDTKVSIQTLQNAVGADVTSLVSMVTDVSKPEDGNRKTRKALDLAHIAKASPEGKTVKLADLISNSKSVVDLDPDFAKVYMREKKELLDVLTEGNAELHNRASVIVNEYFLAVAK